MARLTVVVGGKCESVEYNPQTGVVKCPTCGDVFNVREDASEHHSFAASKNSVVIADGDHGADSASTSRGGKRAREGVLAV
jgi:hypothetical protein